MGGVGTSVVAEGAADDHLGCEEDALERGWQAQAGEISAGAPVAGEQGVASEKVWLVAAERVAEEKVVVEEGVQKEGGSGIKEGSAGGNTDGEASVPGGGDRAGGGGNRGGVARVPGGGGDGSALQFVSCSSKVNVSPCLA